MYRDNCRLCVYKGAPCHIHGPKKSSTGTNPALRTMTIVPPCPCGKIRKGRRPSSDKGQGLWRTVKASDKTGRWER